MSVPIDVKKITNDYYKWCEEAGVDRIEEPSFHYDSIPPDNLGITSPVDGMKLTPEEAERHMKEKRDRAWRKKFG